MIGFPVTEPPAAVLSAAGGSVFLDIKLDDRIYRSFLIARM